jgi:magnesium-protoporphyrin IX monomethyl ester (oxidative) cyclase
LPLPRFYAELVQTQAVLSRKHLGLTALWSTLGLTTRLLLRGQTNFARMLWKFNRVYQPERQYGEHFQPVTYTLQPPVHAGTSKPSSAQLYVHTPLAARRPSAQTSP